MVYDLLKAVDRDTIIGRAFLGIPPDGIPLFSFSMSRKYSVSFMDEEDHETIFKDYGHTSEENNLLGIWNVKLVSDSTVTPVIKTLTYTKENERLQMENFLRGFLSETSQNT